ASLGYAVANMTGANRLLIGLGWSSVVFVTWLRYRQRMVALDPDQALEMLVLLIASAYAVTIPFKGELSLLDTVLLVPLFLGYAWVASRAPAEEPHLVGPTALLGGLHSLWRRLWVAGMFGFATFAIFVSAEPFAHSLVETGE